MKFALYFLLLLSILSINSQDKLNKRFTVKLTTIEKKTESVIHSAIIEVYSNNKRIKTAISDFDGIGIFALNKSDIINNRIELEVYGPKCKIFSKTYKIENNLNLKISLKYGKTIYTNHNQLWNMYKILNINPIHEESTECGLEEIGPIEIKIKN